MNNSLSLLVRKFLPTKTAVANLASLREIAGVRDPWSLYEPIFEDTREYPEYNTINVRLQSFDYPPIERFQKYVHQIAKRFHFKVVQSYAVAAQTRNSVTFKPNSTVVNNEMNYSIYDRVVRLDGVAAPHLHLFVQLLQTHLPVGVTMIVKEHEKTDENYRYIPDILLKQKQEELKSLDDPLVRKNLGWE